MATQFDCTALGSGIDSAPVVDRIMAHPGVQRVPSPKLTLFIKRGFLAPDHCAALIDLVDARRRPSTVSDYNGDAGFRTSETCDLDRAEPAVAEVEALIAAFAGLDPIYGEPIQGQRYAVGQEFKGHTDYFEPGGLDFYKFTSVAGNRTWTVMIYLNEPEAGGATRFKAIDKIVQPESSKEKPGDVGKRAHTPLEVIIPEKPIEPPVPRSDKGN